MNYMEVDLNSKPPIRTGNAACYKKTSFIQTVVTVKGAASEMSSNSCKLFSFCMQEKLVEHIETPVIKMLD